MAGASSFFNKIRLAWISLISNIKSFFFGNNTQHSNELSKDLPDKQHADSATEVVNNALESEEVWYDALEELESDEEYFDAVEDLNEQRSAEIDNIEAVPELKTKKYEENKYYSLQDGLQEKTELDNTSQTLALAFEINELIPGSCNTDLSNLKLFAINKVDHGYALFLKDDKKNCVVLRSECLDMYFPPYFEKHSGKKTYAELFSPKENKTTKRVIVPLQVPQNVEIFTKKSFFNLRRVIQSKIPDFPADVYLEDCEDHVNFYLNSDDNVISLSITSTQAKLAAAASGTPTETNWLIKDILVSGDFANTINKHIREQHEKEKVNSGLEYIGNITRVEAPTIHKG